MENFKMYDEIFTLKSYSNWIDNWIFNHFLRNALSEPSTMQNKNNRLLIKKEKWTSYFS